MNTTLSRRGFIGASALVLAASMAPRMTWAADEKPASATQDPDAKRPAWFSGPIKTIRVEDDLYFVEGTGGNNLVHFDAGRLFIIDSGMSHRGEELAAIALKFSPAAPTKTLFNTHWHRDHAGGNGFFQKAGFTIVASAACRERMGQTITFEDLAMTSLPSPEAARPIITFEDKLKFHVPSSVTITKIAPAHTDTDAVAFFDKYNILHTGDLFFPGAFPVIDRSSGGSLDGMITAAKTLIGMVNDKTRVVPGHGPITDRAGLRAQLDMLSLVRDRLAPLGEKNKSMDEVLAAKPLADLDEKYGKGFLQSPVFTRMAYGQWLTRK